MKIAIIPNENKEKAKLCAAFIVQQLKALGAEILMPESEHELFDDKGILYEDNVTQLIDASDAVIAIGGDGTIIRVAKKCALADKPLLGINFGRIGFVAGLEADEIGELERLVHGDYELDKRMLLKVTVLQDGKENTYYAMNDAVISRGSFSKIIDMNVYLNGNPVSHYRADGLIISTPTGSTAYALSAGGPVIDSSVNCILLVPICSHSLFSRSVIFKSRSKITIKDIHNVNNESFLTIDGDDVIKLSEKDEIRIERADFSANLIKLNTKDFYMILNEKLSERGSGF